MVGYCILASDVFICNFRVKDQFLGVIMQHFSCVLEFTAVNPLAINEFPDFCDKSVGPFESPFFASCVSEIRLLCTYEGFRNET